MFKIPNNPTGLFRKLFGMFRNKNGNNRNPTTVQFYIAFRNLFCLNYFQYSPNANCIKDHDILCHLNYREVGIDQLLMFL